jgi:hypothetical protein
MSFEIRSDEVNVEDVMRLIRKRIEEKRQGVYSDEEIARIAEARLERGLDDADFETGLLAELRQRSPRWNIKIDGDALYASTHDSFVGRLLATVRRRLNPVLRLLINPNPLVLALHRQSQLNTYYVHLLHESAVELTRLNLEVESLKNRLLELTGRLEQMARREKTLEDMVVYRAEAPPQGASQAPTPAAKPGAPGPEGERPA